MNNNKNGKNNLKFINHLFINDTYNSKFMDWSIFK